MNERDGRESSAECRGPEGQDAVAAVRSNSLLLYTTAFYSIVLYVQYSTLVLTRPLVIDSCDCQCSAVQSSCVLYTIHLIVLGYRSTPKSKMGVLPPQKSKVPLPAINNETDHSLLRTVP